MTPERKAEWSAKLQDQFGTFAERPEDLTDDQLCFIAEMQCDLLLSKGWGMMARIEAEVLRRFQALRG